MCYFPTGAALRMCQNCVSGNDSEKRDRGRSRSARQRPDVSQRTPDQGIGGCSALAGPINKIDPSAKTWERQWRTRYTEMKRLHLPTFLAASSVFLHSSPTSLNTHPPLISLSLWWMDLANCQLKWNSICGVERGGHVGKTLSRFTETSLKTLPSWSTCWDSYGQYIKETTLPWLYLRKLQHD